MCRECANELSPPIAIKSLQIITGNFMRLSHQLLIAMSLATIIAIAATSITSVFVASDSLEKAYGDKLSAIADGRRNQLETYLQGLDDKLSGLAKNEVSLAALNMFKIGIEQVKTDNPTEALQGLINIERERDALVAFYKETGTMGYATQLNKFGPTLDQFATENALNDFYLINKNGMVVYTSKAGDEIGTNLIDGPYAETKLGILNKHITEAAVAKMEQAAGGEENTVEIEEQGGVKDTNQVFLEDFAPYELADNKPVAFIGLPVVDANQFFYGSIIVQVPQKQIAAILNNPTGLGKTGETILTSPDGTLLLDSWLTDEYDPLNTKIDLTAFPKVEGREVVQGTITDYRDMTAMISIADVHYDGATWHLAAVINKDEALEGTIEMEIAIATVAAITLIAALAFAFWFARSITRPISAVIGNMKELSSGNTEFELNGMTRKDEVGDIVRSVEGFRQAAIDKIRIEEDALANRSQSEKDRAANEEERIRSAAEVTQTVDQLAKGLETLASGNLVSTLDQPFMESMESVRHNFNTSLGKLREALASIDTGASSIRNVSSEISAATGDLSSRTERQAASLEEAAAAVQELTENVRSAAGQAQEAATLAKSAKTDTDQSSQVVSDAMSAMSRIEQASHDIGGIINVIDEIAFQTNLLALNAGVEAARAGEAGKGFAVVAQEVRELAGRSAEAAKEIKSLIDTSNNEVDQGVKLVKETGEVLEKISTNVSDIDTRISQVANSTSEQLDSIETVNSSVSELDQRIQQNAAMAEETTAATGHLVEEIDSLAQMVNAFDIGTDSKSANSSAARSTSNKTTNDNGLKQMAAKMKTTAPAPKVTAKPTPQPVANKAPIAAATNAAVAHVQDDDDWDEF